MGDRLRALWDFEDLDASEARLRAALEEQTEEVGRAEVLTQLARVAGLRDDFESGDALLDEAAALAGSSALVQMRVALERGRLRRSGGDAEASMPLFLAAYELALADDEEFIAVDAAHMLAIAGPDFDTRLGWSERGIELAGVSDDPEVNGWLGSLYNNVGWDYFDGGDYATALDWFERALVEREKRPDEPQRIAHAREAVEEARNALAGAAPAA
jgi:tetratricopeptide (TPR) repeat protein